MNRREFLGLGGAALAASALAKECEALNAGGGAKRWYKGMIHMHTLWSDGRCLPDQAVRIYKAAGYDFLSLSDHNRLGTDPNRWMPVGEDQGWPPKALEPSQFEQYLKDFPDGDWRERNGRVEVRLATWKELHARFDEPGRFLLMPGVEVTRGTGNWATGRQVHINYANIDDVIPNAKHANLVQDVFRDMSVPTLIRATCEEIEVLAAAKGRPAHVVMVNHPQWPYYDILPQDLIANPQVRFFEVCNNGAQEKPAAGLRDDGWEMDRFWDTVLTARCTKGQPLLYAVASDDTHFYPGSGTTSSPLCFGDGYFCVRAEALTPEALFAAMDRGDFYASQGVAIDGIAFEDGTLRVSVPAKAGVTHKIRFIVTRRGVPYAPAKTVKVEQNGYRRVVPLCDERVGATAKLVSGGKGEAVAGSYRLQPDDLYVRARVESDEKPIYPNPEKFHTRVRCAWTQPYSLLSR